MGMFSLILKQKLLLTMLAAAVVGTAVYAFAATLNVSSGNLQAGNAAVTSCQAGTINATYTTAFNTTVALTASNGSFGVGTVTLTGIHADCTGSKLQINFTDSIGGLLGTGTALSGTIVANNTGASPVTPLVVDVSTLNVPAKLTANVNLAVAA